MLNRRTALFGAGVAALSVAVPASAAEDNTVDKAVAGRFINEVLTAADTSVLAQIVAPDYASPNPDDAAGVDALAARLNNQFQTDGYRLKDIKYSIDDEVLKSPSVFVRGTITGTSTEGKAVKALYFAEFKFKGGLIATSWLLRDERTLQGF